jgi:hypothetical protein
VFAVLAVTFTVQGFLTRDLAWSFAALPCFLVTAWHIVLLRGVPARSDQICIRVAPHQLTRIAGTADAPLRQDWPRPSIANICVEGTPRLVKLLLHLKEKKEPIRLLSGGDRAEMEWIAEQIRQKWQMDK